MSKILAVRVADDGTLHMPVDDIVSGVDGLLARFTDLLPRARPPAAMSKSIAAVAAGGVNANYALSTVDGRLLGYALRETTGAAAARLELRAGADAGGDLLFPIGLASGETTRDWFGPSGIAFIGGLFLSRLAGFFDGAVFLGEI